MLVSLAFIDLGYFKPVRIPMAIRQVMNLWEK